jgi:hypothetical protein
MWQCVVYFALCCVEDLEENLSLDVTESTIDVDCRGCRLIRNGKQRTQKNLTCAVRSWARFASGLISSPMCKSAARETPSPNAHVRQVVSATTLIFATMLLLIRIFPIAC